MTWHPSSNAAVLIVAAVIAGTNAAYAWRRRRFTGAMPFAFLMMAAAGWSLAGAWEASVVELPVKILAAKLQYLGVVSVAPFWFLFAYDYARKGQGRARRNLVVLGVLPAAVAALAATNEWHHWVWKSVLPVSSAPGADLIYRHGIAVWVLMAYSYVLLALGSVYILRIVRGAAVLNRRHAGILLTGCFIPWVGNFLYLSRLNPFPGLDLTLIGFAVSGPLVAWSIFRYRLLDLMPVALDAIFNVMPGGVLVLDFETRVVDLNPAARRILGLPEDAVGRLSHEVFTGWPDLGAAFPHLLDLGAERPVRSADGRRWIGVRLSTLRDRGGPVSGHLILVRDITTSKNARDALEASLREKEALLKEVYHRVRNNMQVISSLLNHQARLIRDPEVLEMFKESQNRIRSMALVHEMLYRSGDLSRIDFAAYIRSLVVYLMHSLRIDADRIGYGLSVGKIELEISTAVPVGLIVNELVTNALRHAFPDGRRGRIDIALDAAPDGALTLAVRDDGVGLPEGFAPDRASSLGLQIVEMLVQQIEGTMTAGGGAGGGTEFRIVFGRPKPDPGPAA